MFSIIETLQNYFTCELLHDSLSSDVSLHFSVSLRRPYLVVSCSEEAFCRPVRPLWCGICCQYVDPVLADVIELTCGLSVGVHSATVKSESDRNNSSAGTAAGTGLVCDDGIAHHSAATAESHPNTGTVYCTYAKIKKTLPWFTCFHRYQQNS